MSALSARRQSVVIHRLIGFTGLGVLAVIIIAPFTAASAATAPNDGAQPIQVGVQIQSGAFVPQGTTTGNTEATITETGPNAPDPQTTTCDTDPATQDPGSTATYCTFAVVQNLSSARADDIPLDELYFAQPGDSVTVTQTTVNAGLQIDSSTKTFGPCQLTPDDQNNLCSDQTALFNDPGLPPKAHSDSGSVTNGQSVVIDVTANDTSNGAPTTIAVDSPPSHGKATPVPSASSTTSHARAAGVAASSIRYTPNTGFSGHDSFSYTLSDANGSSTASVSVVVHASLKAPEAIDDKAHTTSGNPVTIDVLRNDKSEGSGAMHVTSVGAPGHGTARIVGRAIVYRPVRGFTGIDTFRYTASDSGGHATAEVTVTVTAPVVSSPQPTPAPPQAATLPNTGAPVAVMAAEALVLITGGSLLMTTARRRHRVDGAG